RQGHGHLLPPALIFILSRNPMSSTSLNSTRISRRFAELRASGELGIIAYITAGDPSLDATYKFVLALAEAGADVIELGIPFSDPLADGPTIQRASERALRAGTTLPGVLGLVRRLLQSDLSDGCGKIRGRRILRRGRRCLGHRSHSRRIRRLPPRPGRSSPRYC